MMLNKTFYLLLLSLIPIFGFSQANSQYPDSGNKIRLGFQTTGDGLIWRDTQPNVGIYQPINNKAAWIILDTANNKFYHYKNNTWILAGGSTFDTTTLNLVSRFALKLNISDTSLMLTNYYRSGRALGTPTSATLTNATGLPLTTGVTGTLGGGNGGTGITTFGAVGRIPYASSTTVLTTNSNLLYDGTRLRTNQVAIGDTASNTVGITNLLSLSGGSGAGFTLKSTYDSPILRSFTFLINALGNVGFWNNNLSSYAYFINNSDNYLGIGTTSPSAVLEVSGTSANTDFRISRTVSSSTYFYIKAPGGSPSTSTMGVNGVDVMVLNASGSVGIGTISPLAKLQVNGSGVTSSTTALKVDNNGNTNLLTVLDNGNLGIGTTNPQSGLVISKYGSNWDGDAQYFKPTGNIFLSMGNAVANQDNWFGIRGDYGSSSGTANILLQANFRDVNSQAGHYIASKATALGIADFEIGKLVTSTSVSTPPTKVPQLYITSGGNVGIGTTVVTAPLTVAGTSDLAWSASTSKLQISRSGTVARLQNYDNGSAASLALQWEGGNVGIGMSSPSTKLTVKGVTFTDNGVTGGASGLVYAISASSGGNFGQIGNTGTRWSLGYGLSLTALGTEVLVWDASGNVGIGTTSPTEKLHVVGNGLFTDTVRIEDAIKVGANNAYVYSAGTGNYYFTKDYKNQNGLYHIAIGNGVLSNATTVSNPTSSRHGSVGIGFNNLKNLTQSASTNQGVWNTSIGYNNMSSVTTGGFNTGLGANSLVSLTTGGSNVALGTLTLENMTTGGSNLGIGDGALRFLTTGDSNIGIGSNAGDFDAVNGNQVTSLNNSIYIGQRADPSATTGVTNEIVIGKEAKGQGSNSIMLGNSSVTNAYCYDNTFSTPSDFRDKTNIENLNTGLDLILNLRPVKFQWNMRDYGKVGYKDIGFIAQEALNVQNINNEADNIKLVNDENQNQLSMQSGNLIPILVKAMQEQQAQIEALKQKLLILENK